MSDVQRYTITSAHITQARMKPSSLQTFFTLLGWNGGKGESLPHVLEHLLMWKKRETLLFRLQKHAPLMMMSPIIVFFYGRQEGMPLIWILLPLSLPIAMLAAFLFWAFKTHWFGKKLSLLENGFVSLVGHSLIENLPQHRFLLREQLRLQSLLSKIQQKIEELHRIQNKLIAKSRELNEDSSDLLRSMEEERGHIQRVYEETQKILHTINQKLLEFEKQRSNILKRAELEYIRGQARAISQEEQTRFSQRALADLEIDEIFLQQSIGEVEEELGKHGVRFEIENQLSR
jgi:hypothetical protein